MATVRRDDPAPAARASPVARAPKARPAVRASRSRRVPTAIVRKGGDVDTNIAKAEKAVNAELNRLFG